MNIYTLRNGLRRLVATIKYIIGVCRVGKLLQFVLSGTVIGHRNPEHGFTVNIGSINLDGLGIHHLYKRCLVGDVLPKAIDQLLPLEGGTTEDINTGTLQIGLQLDPGIGIA